MVGEGFHVLSEAFSIVYDVEWESAFILEPRQVFVDARRLPVGVRENRAIGNAIERLRACHERHNLGLDASAGADYG